MNTKTNRFAAATVKAAPAAEKEATVRTSFDLPADLSRRLRIYCASKGVYQRELLQDLLDAHLKKEGF